MSARDELSGVISEAVGGWNANTQAITRVSDAILAAGYSKPRTITTAAELEALPFGSAVQTSDADDTVVLKCEGEFFRNQTGAEVDWTTLWRFGTHPFTVLYTPKES